MYIVKSGIDIDKWGTKEVQTVKEGGYFCSMGKAKARRWALKQVIKAGSCLELGIGKEGTFHQMVKAQAPEARIVSVDDGRNLGNIKELQKMAKENKDFIIMDFYKWAKQGLETFSVVWMDYCGPWTDRIARDIKIATRVMRGSGTIMFTLLEAREHVHQLGLPAGASRAQIDAAIEKAIEKAFADAGLRVTKIKEIKYQSSPEGTSKSSNMRVVAYRYTKI